MTVGQACEQKWLQASKMAVEARWAKLADVEALQRLHQATQTVPAEIRRQWVTGEIAEELRDDLEQALPKGATAPSEGPTASKPRVYFISQPPLHGSRKRIYAEVGAEFGLEAKTVANLWEQYVRRLREP